MNKVKIKLELNLDSDLGKNVFASMSLALAGLETGPNNHEGAAEDLIELKEVVEVVETVKPRAPRARKEVPEPAIAENEEVTAGPGPKAEEIERAPEGGTSGEDVTVEMVKAEISKKVNNHREAIKAKLTEFGVDNSAKLPPAKLPAMYKFVKELD